MDTNTRPILLCLSGGGFRATLFHLGVVRFLAEVEFLPRVTHVFSVSGGSVLAAHMALHWRDYTSKDPRDFRTASNEIVRFAQFDLRGRIVRRMLWRRRTSMLQSYYDALYKRARLGQLPLSPQFHFLATSLTTGQLCALTRESFVVTSSSDEWVRRYPAESQPLAEAVAASSAFPPLFPPVKFDLPELGRKVFERPEYLSDGGVFDNLGVSQLPSLVPSETLQASARIVISDASGDFDARPGNRFSLLLPRSLRTTDILMQRVAVLETRLVERLPDVQVLSIATLAQPRFGKTGNWRFKPQSPRVQRLLRRVRTDFDVFNTDLVRALTKHGYETAFETLVGAELSTVERAQPVESSTATWDPYDPCPAGWPSEPEILRRAKAMKQAEGLLAAIRPVPEAIEALNRVIEGREPRPAPPPQSVLTTEGDSYLEDLIRRAAKRPIGLVNHRDPAFWFLLFVALLALALTLR